MKTSHLSINGIVDARSHKRLLNKGKLLLTALAFTLSSGASAAIPNFVTISNVSVTEPAGSATTVNAVFQVNLRRNVFSEQDVVINFTTVNGTATTGSGDYLFKAGSLTFSGSQTSENISVKVKADTDGAEPTEIFGVYLTSASNAQLFDSQGVATITNTPIDDGFDECPDGSSQLPNGHCPPPLP